MKPLFIISCPIDTYSGYGARSRDIVKAIIELDRYDVKILPQRWGNCPWNFIKNHKREWGFLESYLLPQGNQLPERPQIWAQITVPNEFQPVGLYNIGITAGIETTICPAEWIEGINRMDLNLVSSEHSKKVILDSKFEQIDSRSQQKIGIIQTQKPVEVLFEGVDLETFFPKKSTFNLNEIEEEFAYLFVGHWLPGNTGHDRKNVGAMIHSFLNTFKNKKNPPALILKTSGSGTSYMDRELILKKINRIYTHIKKTARTLPNIYLFHGEISNSEMNELYNHKKVKAMISATKGEGFGRPLLEFSLTKKPILTTNWSGHTDFLDPQFTTLIAGELTQVDESAANKFLLKESKWFDYSRPEFEFFLEDIPKKYKKYKENAVRQAYKSKTDFSYEAMKNLLSEYLTKADSALPQPVKLDLPEITLL